MTELASTLDIMISNSYEMFIADCKILACNCPAAYSFDLGVKLSDKRPFSLTWFLDGKRNFVFSLYSDESGKDVGEIARKFGGSGGKNFASFTLKLEDVDKMFDLTGEIFS